MEINIHHAKTHLSRLIAAAEAGEEVIIARSGKPAVKLVLAVTEAESKIKPPDRVFGRLKSKLNLPANWEEEFDLIGKELEDSMINESIFLRTNRTVTTVEDSAGYSCADLGDHRSDTSLGESSPFHAPRRE